MPDDLTVSNLVFTFFEKSLNTETSRPDGRESFELFLEHL